MQNTKKTLLALSLFLVSSFLIFFTSSKAIESYSKIPSRKTLLASLENRSYHKHTEVVDRKGRIIGFLSVTNRVFTPYEKIPKAIISNFILSEDPNFLKHHGFIFSKILNDFISSKTEKSPHTITQKLAKMYFQETDKKSFSFFQNFLLSLWLEKNLSKKEILEHYLNRVAITNESLGIGSASKELFGKNLEELNFEEQIALSSLRNSESKQESKKRKTNLLKQLQGKNRITQNDYEYWKRRGLNLQRKEQKQNSLLLLVKKELEKTNFRERNLKENLRVTSSLDLDYQRPLSKHHSNQSPFLLIDKSTGAIRSSSQKANDTKTFPLGLALTPLYSAFALDKGFHLYHKVSFNPYTKRTRNKTDPTLYETLINPKPEFIAELFLSLGIGVLASFTKNLDLPISNYDLSLANSSDKVSLNNLASAYGVLYNKGKILSPHLITKIETIEKKTLIYKRIEKNKKSFLSPEAAYIVEKALEIKNKENSIFISNSIDNKDFFFTGTKGKLLFIGAFEKSKGKEIQKKRKEESMFDFTKDFTNLLKRIPLKEEDRKTPFVSSKISFGKSKIKKYQNKMLPFKTKRSF